MPEPSIIPIIQTMRGPGGPLPIGGWASFVAGEAVECPATVTRSNDRRRGEICRRKLCVVGPGTIVRVRNASPEKPEFATIETKCPVCAALLELQVLVAIAELVA